eukprot:FR735436.1.p1 GENE.FR735436.1~~FR735436.1.p1  ORF type:complete len:220 (+),score=20.87 FR735436.1:102-662(+)
MIEDQVSPKRCGHVAGKAVVGRDEALLRIKAAVKARDQLQASGRDIVLIARTDAAHTDFEEALERCRLFHQAGADITVLEAPGSLEEMRRYCDEVPGPKLANMLENGKTPILPPHELQEMGYTIAAYPLTLLSTSIRAMDQALSDLKSQSPVTGLSSFARVKEVVGFSEYHEKEELYSSTSTEDRL